MQTSAVDIEKNTGSNRRMLQNVPKTQEYRNWQRAMHSMHSIRFQNKELETEIHSKYQNVIKHFMVNLTD